MNSVKGKRDEPEGEENGNVSGNALKRADLAELTEAWPWTGAESCRPATAAIVSLRRECRGGSEDNGIRI